MSYSGSNFVKTLMILNIEAFDSFIIATLLDKVQLGRNEYRVVKLFGSHI